jgi:UDP-N-acetyl-2-amino-2-deoxyglucuronate dehydrogenase
MRAIRDTGNTLVAALDISDSVGIIDSYFPDADFFTEFERFDRHVDLLRRKGEPVDYVSICSPNYLHDAHIRFALRSGADAICEKPLVLNPWNLDGLMDVEKDSGRKVYSILQLRLHPAIIELKKKIEQSGDDRTYNVELTYITSRGQNTLHYSSDTAAAGYLEFERAKVRWFLSVDARHLPASAVEAGQRTYRSITVDGDEIEFSGGFTDLHTASYEHILQGEGFGLEVTRSSVEMVSNIRRMEPVGKRGDYHPHLDNLDE